MEERAIIALKKSIEHWKNIRDGKEAEDSVDNCLLCKEYFDGGCVGCPVFEETEVWECRDTPYMGWMTHHKVKHALFANPRSIVKGCKKCLKLAQAEISFLESLLPTEGGSNV